MGKKMSQYPCFKGDLKSSQTLCRSIYITGSYLLDVQRRIVENIEAERKLVEANKKLIEIYERKINAKLTEIWGEETPFYLPSLDGRG